MSTRPDRCATIGHSGIPATHEITWTHSSARDAPVTERVCASCADGYVRRPALQATARLLSAPKRAEPRQKGRSR